MFLENLNLNKLRHLTVLAAIFLFWVWEIFEHFILPPKALKYFLIEVSVFTLFFGAILYLLYGALFKISFHLKKSQQKLMSLQSYQASILESSPCAIIALNANRQIYGFNKQAEKISGYLLDEAMGMDIEKLFKEDKNIRRIFAKNHINEKIESVDETFILTKPGTEAPVALVVWVLRGNLDNGPAFVLILGDLREKKKIEKRLSLYEKMAATSHLAAGLAHQLRNPLASMSVNLKNLSDEFESYQTKNKAEIEKYLTRVSSDIRKLSRLVDNFVKTIVPRKIDVSYGTCLLTDILNSALGQNQTSLDSKAILLIKNFTEESVLIKCDLPKVVQAFSNIIQNAIEAISESGKIEIKIVPDDQWTMVEICDNGCGIPAERLNRIFDLYHTTKPAGLGIGLSLAALIIEEHGGKIEVASKVNKGTCVTVTLPCHDTLLARNGNKNESQ